LIAMSEEPEPRFEAAVSQLEEIVESLERGEPELTKALAKYETGVRLLTECYSLLERAERSVALLTGVDKQGNPITVPFDATATLERERGSSLPSSPGAARPAAAEKPTRSRRARPPLDQEPDPSEPPF
jgi:exodeoxyribonuclease VII small subunit